MIEKNSRDILLFGSIYIKQKDYWSKALAGVSETTDILLDFDNRTTSTPGTGEIELDLPNGLGERVVKTCKGYDLSIYILLLAVLKSLIFRYTANEDILILSPVNKLKVTEKTLNTLLVIRSVVEGRLTFKELVLKVRQSVLDAHENQDYPYDKLVEYLFPAASGEMGTAVSNILCSLNSLHHEEDIDTAGSRLSFQFKRDGTHLTGRVFYDTATCRENEVSRIATHLVRILEGAVANVNTSIGDILFMTEVERKQILVEFNGNKADFPRDRSIYHFIEDHAANTPHKTALIFKDNEISYRDLNRRADRLSQRLRSIGAGRDRTVGVLMDRSPEMVESILATWKAGGAYIPIDPRDPSQRINEILQDSQTGILITTAPYLEQYPGLSAIADLGIIRVDEAVNETETRQGSTDVPLDMNSLSYVIYTSGSTGKPKGAMVEHIGMMNHIQAKVNDLQVTETSIVAQNASHTFDISVWQFFTSLVRGGQTIIIPDEWVRDPEQLISEVVHREVSILEVVPSYLSAMLEFLDLKPRPLDTLSYLLVTGETVTPRLVERWFETYPNIKMINAYGPTEASDDITHFLMTEASRRRSIPIGSPIQNMDIYIVDENMKLYPVGIKGEICVSGVGVGRGYLNNETKTREVFTLDHFNETESVRLYKTGDLGRWLADGTIEFFGRKDHQVKIRGFRIELGEIEIQLAHHPDVKEAVVIVKESAAAGGQKHLCAFMTTRRRLEPPAVKEFLLERLPHYMIPDQAVELDQMPLTPNGKVDRKALAKIETAVNSTVAYVAPRDEMEETLAEIWSEVLELEKDVIGIDANFFELGGHSLKATSMAANIYKRLNAEIPLGEIFRAATIREQAETVRRLSTAKLPAILPIEEQGHYPLSPGQKRLYILQQMDPGGTFYNLPYVLHIEGDFDETKLEEAFKKMISRHESLRTSFPMVAERPVQKVHDTVDFAVQYFNAAPHEVAGIIESFTRPFDLTCPPLFRVGLIRVDGGGSLLMVDLHHIVTDGASEYIIIGEFSALYTGAALPPLKIQYRDYSHWQNSREMQESLARQREFWMREFQGNIPVLQLPTDYPRSGNRSFEGDTLRFVIEKNHLDGLRQVAREENSTLFMVILAIYNVFLTKLSGQDDIVVGIGISGREKEELQSLIGMFVNTLALRNYPRKEKTFRQFLTEVKEKTLRAFDNQDYPFEDLVDDVLPQREDHNRNPLFDCALVSQNMGMQSHNAEKPESTGFSIKPYEYKNKVSKFDLSLYYSESTQELSCRFEYSTRLFRTDTIERFIRYFREIVSGVIGADQVKLSDITISHNLLRADNAEADDQMEIEL